MKKDVIKQIDHVQQFTVLQWKNQMPLTEGLFFAKTGKCGGKGAHFLSVVIRIVHKQIEEDKRGFRSIRKRISKVL